MAVSVDRNAGMAWMAAVLPAGPGAKRQGLLRMGQAPERYLAAVHDEELLAARRKPDGQDRPQVPADRSQDLPAREMLAGLANRSAQVDGLHVRIVAQRR